MGTVAILTDTNSGFTQEEADAAGIFILPTPFSIDDVLYYVFCLPQFFKTALRMPKSVIIQQSEYRLMMSKTYLQFISQRVFLCINPVNSV